MDIDTFNDEVQKTVKYLSQKSLFYSPGGLSGVPKV